ncbi:MAG TPA: ribosome-associated translation inhibitor RaiA [bacterium]|jgi:putative sigma-54 modulation protein|nr:ribosome-associated translation inhibitor RaiA [bacterium]HNZ51111.1 ribosome-associated translation inhibitor RaiA [bacterium]HOH85341.1 ribosome-associated translation inhibitor RaiA [bacterium]HPW44398.1 ribosome-associated translation inhibitor RaiA [bacterium]HPX64274.1 ribosome-associated translation inhibitor RaiA [bacterium]
MQANIKAHGFELTLAITNYIKKKINMLDKYLGDIQPIACDVQVELMSRRRTKGDIFRAEINLQLPGELLRIEKTEPDLYKAIEKVKDHLAQMIIKYKEKKSGR